MNTATTYDRLPDSGQLEFREQPLLRGNREDDDLDIDITPMIDITFLMLVFFLVASTPDKQTAVILPSAVHGVAVSQLQSTLFTVGDGGLDMAPLYNADGKMSEFQLSDDKDLRHEQIREIVSKGLQEENKDSVVIKADRTVAFREVARVIKSASQVEGVQIHIAVLEND